MTDDNKQPVEDKSIIKWLLTGAAIVFTSLMFYFASTDEPPFNVSSLTSDFVNKSSLHLSTTNISYNWWALLLTLAGIIFLPLCYLAVTKKLNGIYEKLISSYRLFKSSINVHEEVNDIVIILAIIVALSLFFVGLSFNCCGWWDAFSTQLFGRLSNPNEPLNLRYILIGIAGMVTLFFAWRRLIIADQQKESQIRATEIEYERGINQRFDNAVTALSKELNDSSFPVHLDAISHLSTIAIDSPAHTKRCLSIICRYNEWMEEYVDEFVKRINEGPYISWLLHKDNRIVKKDSQYKVGGITLLQEKRSQEALVAIRNILEYISINNPEQLRTLDFRNKMLCGINLNNLKLDNINFENVYLVAASLNKISLKKAKLGFANLQGANLIGTNLQEIDLMEANLKGAYLDSADLRNAYLKNINLQGAYLQSTNLHGAYLEHANLREAYLDDAYLGKAYLVNVNLERASLVYVNLQGVSLDYANLQGAYLDDASLQGASLWNSNLHGASLTFTELQGATLTETNLQEARLINTQLQGTTIDDVDLSDAMLLDCNLYGATLKSIKSENIMFNNIVGTDYIDKDRRVEWVNNICKDIKPEDVKLFIENVEMAWQAMDNNQEPDGLEAIKKNSVVFIDNQGKYDISEKYLAHLQERWQNMLNEKDAKLFFNMKNSLLSLIGASRRYIGKDLQAIKTKNSISRNKNANLVNKLLALIEQLIASNNRPNNK